MANTIDDDFESWLQAVKAADDAPFRPGRPAAQMPGYDDESQPPIVTDRDGRFTLTGIGADRLARLELRGDMIAYAALDVVAHSIQPVTLQGQAWRNEPIVWSRFYVSSCSDAADRGDRPRRGQRGAPCRREYRERTSGRRSAPRSRASSGPSPTRREDTASSACPREAVAAGTTKM